MNAFVLDLAVLHQQDLMREAELLRRAKLSQGSRTSVPAWRRSLSGLLTSAARSLDPSIEVQHAPPLPSGRGASALPACC
jgi:hypothetical protein